MYNHLLKIQKRFYHFLVFISIIGLLFYFTDEVQAQTAKPDLPVEDFASAAYEGISEWQYTSSMNTARRGFGAAASNGYIYVLGGQDSGWNNIGSVEYTHVESNGSLSAWQTTTALTTSTALPGAAVYNGYIYIVGGYTDKASNIVEYAAINPDGSLGTWTPTSALIQGRVGPGVVAVNGYLYAIGGDDAGGNAFSSAEYAPINPDGSLGTWQTTNSMPQPRQTFGLAASNQTIYALGGRSDGSYLNSVNYAAINSDGTLSTWQTTSAMTSSRVSFGAERMGAYVFAVSGWNGGSSSAPLTSVEYAAIQAGGGLGSWKTTSPLNKGREDLRVVASGNYLYAIGGGNAYGALYNSVEVTTFSAKPLKTPVLRSPKNKTMADKNPTLLWTAVAGATRYSLQVATDAGFSNLVIDSDDITTTTYTPVTSLDLNQTFFWRVKASNDSGAASAWSNVFRFYTEPAQPVPSLPTDGSYQSTLKPSFTWTDTSNAGRYQLRISTSSTCSGGKIYTAAGLSYTIKTPLKPGKTYYWVIRGKGIAKKYGDWSICSSFIAPPARPILVSPKNGKTIKTDLPTLIWKPAAGANEYLLQLASSPDFSTGLKEWNITDGARYTLTTNLYDGAYYWRVKASNTGGEASEWSKVYRFKVTGFGSPSGSE
jgi:hypothetical protein